MTAKPPPIQVPTIPAPARVDVQAMLVPKPVINSATVARLLGRKEATFFGIRRELEEQHGFPPNLPGLKGWSYACVMRWIETNGQTFLPADPEPAPPPRENRLERRYAQ